jgi:hypothetical protein
MHYALVLVLVGIAFIAGIFIGINSTKGAEGTGSGGTGTAVAPLPSEYSYVVGQQLRSEIRDLELSNQQLDLDNQRLRHFENNVRAIADRQGSAIERLRKIIELLPDE